MVFYCLCLALGSAVGAAAAESPRSLTGRLLVATSEMKDPRFVETVLYVVRHDESGAMALVVNRPVVRRRIVELLEPGRSGSEGPDHEITLHYGGPVEPNRAFVLHTDDYRLASTVRLRGGIALTGEVEILHDMARSRGPRRALFAFGYAGWAPGQLEAEMKKNGWFEIAPDEELIFGQDWESKWERARDKRKIDL